MKLFLSITLGLFLATPAFAVDATVKCETSKLKEAGKYTSCRLKAEAKGIQKGIAADFAKCEEKFADKWAKIEDKAGPGVCPTEFDVAGVEAGITNGTTRLAIVLAGGTVPNYEAELLVCQDALVASEGDLQQCIDNSRTYISFTSTVTHLYNHGGGLPAGVQMGDTVTFTVSLPNTAPSTLDDCSFLYDRECEERDYDLGTAGYALTYSSGYVQYGVVDSMVLKEGGCSDPLNKGDCSDSFWNPDTVKFFDGATNLYEVVAHGGRITELPESLRTAKDNLLTETFSRTHYWGDWGNWGSYHYDYTVAQGTTIVTEQ